MQLDESAVLAMLDEYSPEFVGVGDSDRGSIPLGNGELCANAWVETDGLHFYLARSDALTEFDRTVKLGEWVVRLEPNPFQRGSDVVQKLDLVEGNLKIQSRGAHGIFDLTFFIDSEYDEAFVEVTSSSKIEMSVELYCWRNSNNSVVAALDMFWGDENPEDFPALAAIRESADIVTESEHALVAYHQNSNSIVPAIVKMHGLDAADVEVPDLLINRIFGTKTTIDPIASVSGRKLTSVQTTKASARVSTFSAQGQPLSSLIDALPKSLQIDERRAATATAWNEYWKKSWIFVSGDEAKTSKATDKVAGFASQNGLPSATNFNKSQVTRAYILTKFMTACGSAGAMPILYNGALFTTMPGANSHVKLDSFGKAFTSKPSTRPTLELNPDERSWSLESLWQNLRLPYYSVLSRGEPEALRPVFEYYRRFWSVNRARARLHQGVGGQWNTEMTLTCGLQTPGIYGLDRNGVEATWTKNRWGGAINFSPGLELCKLMFDYWRFTKDNEFLHHDLLPYALDLVEFADSKYFNPESGLIEFRSLNSLETYFDCTNPTAIVAGYVRLTKDLLSLPESALVARSEIEAFKFRLPSLPMDSDPQGREYIAPASFYTPIRMNVESPELYAIYPFDLRDDIADEILDATWDHAMTVSGSFRPAVIGEKLGTPSFSGWQYHGQVAAMTGRIKECLEVLTENSALTNPGFAFPAMWGPVYDSVPDVDHGANILNTLQQLVIEICSRPDLAKQLPKDLALSFKLYDSDGSPLTGEIKDQVLTLVN